MGGGALGGGAHFSLGGGGWPPVEPPLDLSTLPSLKLKSDYAVEGKPRFAACRGRFAARKGSWKGGNRICKQKEMEVGHFTRLGGSSFI